MRARLPCLLRQGPRLPNKNAEIALLKKLLNPLPCALGLSKQQRKIKMTLMYFVGCIVNDVVIT